MKYPFNAVTGNSYSEANTLQLIQAGYSSPEFATYNQWKSIGRQVKAGTKGTKRIRVVTINKDSKREKQTVRNFYVFNIEQTEELSTMAKDDAFMATTDPQSFTDASMALLHKLSKAEA